MAQELIPSPASPSQNCSAQAEDSQDQYDVPGNIWNNLSNATHLRTFRSTEWHHCTTAPSLRLLATAQQLEAD
jgi:hypothetical protein